MSNAISVQSATRTFGRTKAIDRLSFTVADGSILGLLGRNGAGKTTIMSIIAGQDRPTSASGTADAAGRLTADRTGLRSHAIGALRSGARRAGRQSASTGR
ncbi:MAG TPA: ATP-binding cassette domain-containing protein [Microbacteriaceae bacterium]